MAFAGGYHSCRCTCRSTLLIYHRVRIGNGEDFDLLMGVRNAHFKTNE